MATAATRREKNFVIEKTRTHYESRIPLTPTGLLMEGHYTQISTTFDSVHIQAFVSCRDEYNEIFRQLGEGFLNSAER
jgi:hypothetical protein